MHWLRPACSRLWAWPQMPDCGQYRAVLQEGGSGERCVAVFPMLGVLVWKKA
jgi:hypothetical protein